MRIALQICSTHEWKSIKEILGIRPGMTLRQPFGQYFKHSINGQEGIFYQSGDTKTRSSAACQFAIDRWHPDRIINLGTCGGVAGEIQKLDLILADKTVQYDCIIRFGEPPDLFYKPMITTIDTSWVNINKVSTKIHKGTIASADQDLNVEWRERLREENVLGADWESGAISKGCELNRVKCFILRGVTDVPDATQAADFEKNTPIVMESLFQTLTQIRFL